MALGAVETLQYPMDLVYCLGGHSASPSVAHRSERIWVLSGVLERSEAKDDNEAC